MWVEKKITEQQQQMESNIVDKKNALPKSGSINSSKNIGNKTFIKNEKKNKHSLIYDESNSLQIIPTLKYILPDLPLSQAPNLQDISFLDLSKPLNQASMQWPDLQASSSANLTLLSQRITKKNVPKRIKRKSKYTKEDDNLIINLKRAGYNWSKIATMMNVKSSIAVRNRYQVLMGQQGSSILLNNWTESEVSGLKELLDVSELLKWETITTELRKVTNKDFSVHQVFMVCRTLLAEDPSTFGISESLVHEMTQLHDLLANKANKFNLNFD